MMQSMEERLSFMINEAEDLLARAGKIKSVPGGRKLERKMNAELNALLKFKKTKISDALENHLKSTNLTNLRAILQAVENSPGVVAVLKTFYYERTGCAIDEVVVDAVVGDGYKWIKIVARKPLAVHKIWAGQGQYGDKDIISVAEDYLCAGEQNLINYESPTVCFLFPRGVTQSVYDSLKAIRVEPIGKVLPDPDLHNLRQSRMEEEADFDLLSKLLADFTATCTKVNLDITTLIVLTSAVTNGGANYVFPEEILTKQAEEERTEPALPKIEAYLSGKELIVCRTAYDHFQEILQTVGGEGEKHRAKELMKRVHVVDDTPAEYAMTLEESSSVKLRSKIIFGTGETFQAITTTANTAFVRAAANQGVKFSVYFHPSRALSEQKQQRAVHLDMTNVVPVCANNISIHMA